MQIAEKYRPIIKRKAEENRLATQNNNQASEWQKSSTQVHTRDELAKIAKVSHDTNIMQRGIGNVNPMKMAKCILELERIYGISNGNNQHSLRNNFVSKTQDDLAQNLDIDKRQIQNYKKLLTLIPELQSLIEDGELSPTVGYKVLAKLNKEEQELIIKSQNKLLLNNLETNIKFSVKNYDIITEKYKCEVSNMYEYHVSRFHPNDKTMCKLGIFETDLEILLKDFQINGGWEFVSFTNNPNPEDKAVLCVFRKDSLLNESGDEAVKNLKDIPVYFFNSKDDKQIGNDIKPIFCKN